MRLKRFAPLLFASLSLCSFNTFQSVEASIKKQFKNQSSCSFETSTFEKVKVNGFGETMIYRYCISPDKRVMLYEFLEGGSGKYYTGKESKVQEGFLGKEEVIFQNYVYKPGYYLYLWDIEGDELVQYKCQTNDSSNCSDEVERVVHGKKIVNNQTSQQSLEVKTINFANGTYVGEVEGDSIANGKGTITFNNGDKYVGEFKDNQYNGFGKFYKNDVLVYEGNYINNNKEGKGIYYYSGGNKFEGDFKNDLENGTGIYTWADGTSKCVELNNGEFKSFC